jgi:hypothetical protein
LENDDCSDLQVERRYYTVHRSRLPGCRLTRR